MGNTTISYKRTILGWYNVTIEGLMRYNINPITFRRAINISKDTVVGTCEIESTQLEELKRDGKFIGLANGWEWVVSDDIVNYV